MKAPILLFIHIPKTAGTTMAAILDRNYRRSSVIDIYPSFGISLAEFKDLPGSTLDAAECIKGHFDFGLHRELGGRAFRYATVVRDPIEQVRSRYHHMRTSRFHHLHHLAEKGTTLAEFAAVPDNYQTRTLLTPPGGREHPPLTEQDLEQAKRNLLDFAWVGVAERFDETLVLLESRGELGDIRYVSRNVRRQPAERKPPAGAERLALEAATRFDRELYAWCASRLDREVAEQGDAFRARVDAFRRANARYARRMWLLDGLAHRWGKLLGSARRKLAR